MPRGGKRKGSGRPKGKQKRIALCLSESLHACIPGNKSAYIRDAVKQRLVDDGIIGGSK